MDLVWAMGLCPECGVEGDDQSSLSRRLRRLGWLGWLSSLLFAVVLAGVNARTSTLGSVPFLAEPPAQAVATSMTHDELLHAMSKADFSAPPPLVRPLLDATESASRWGFPGAAGVSLQFGDANSVKARNFGLVRPWLSWRRLAGPLNEHMELWREIVVVPSKIIALLGDGLPEYFDQVPDGTRVFLYGDAIIVIPGAWFSSEVMTLLEFRPCALAIDLCAAYLLFRCVRCAVGGRDRKLRHVIFRSPVVLSACLAIGLLMPRISDGVLRRGFAGRPPWNGVHVAFTREQLAALPATKAADAQVFAWMASDLHWWVNQPVLFASLKQSCETDVTRGLAVTGPEFWPLFVASKRYLVEASPESPFRGGILIDVDGFASPKPKTVDWPRGPAFFRPDEKQIALGWSSGKPGAPRYEVFVQIDRLLALLAAVVAFGLLTHFTFVTRLRRRAQRRGAAGRCPHCGYQIRERTTPSVLAQPPF